MVYDSYQPFEGYYMANLYFHWNTREFMIYFCKIESIPINNKSGLFWLTNKVSMMYNYSD
jgi:hypothetical protein